MVTRKCHGIRTFPKLGANLFSAQTSIMKLLFPPKKQHSRQKAKYRMLINGIQSTHVRQCYVEKVAKSHF